MSIENFVRKNVSSNLEKKQGVKNDVAFDPTIILTIISVITTLIKDCDLFNKKPEDIKKTVEKVGLFERWALKIQVRAALDDNRMFKLYGQQITNALAESGPNASVEEIVAAIEEVKGPFKAEEVVA